LALRVGSIGIICIRFSKKIDIFPLFFSVFAFSRSFQFSDGRVSALSLENRREYERDLGREKTLENIFIF